MIKHTGDKIFFEEAQEFGTSPPSDLDIKCESTICKL